jgi:hypothetical protein
MFMYKWPQIPCRSQLPQLFGLGQPSQTVTVGNQQKGSDTISVLWAWGQSGASLHQHQPHASSSSTAGSSTTSLDVVHRRRIIKPRSIMYILVHMSNNFFSSRRLKINHNTGAKYAFLFLSKVRLRRNTRENNVEKHKRPNRKYWFNCRGLKCHTIFHEAVPLNTLILAKLY